jgi:uncharacterized membrane protein YvbJ
VSYCQNCGAKRDAAINFCSYCGYKFEKKKETDNKDVRIKELEQKIVQLEQKQVKGTKFGPFSPWMAIVPIAFVTAFFGLFILLIWIIRQ